jgi:metal-responsive CopG/Arc/MetJ family transcriptional regulator
MTTWFSYKGGMKTIAVAIDETTLQILDDLTTTAAQPCSRSALVRAAIREFVEREHKRKLEAQEGEILRKHKKRLAHQARALVTEQARL